MAETITINIVGNEVGIQYQPDSKEAVLQNEMFARELGLSTLALQAIRLRQRMGLPVPAALIGLVEAHTYLELA